jgi:serine/threonine-protein phosphatase 2A regulatory subunit B'
MFKKLINKKGKKDDTTPSAAASTRAGTGDASDAKVASTRRDNKPRTANGLHSIDYFSDLEPVTKEDLLKPQVTFQTENPSGRALLFVKKLRLCSIMFDWDPVDEMQMPITTKPESREETRAKEVKRQLLLELVDYIGQQRDFLNEAIMVEILKMVACNLFRCLSRNDSGMEADEDEPVFEPAWPHLQIVYEFFLRFIVSNDLDLKILKKHINGTFVLHVLELFDSEDPRERDYLKTILHRIYSKFMPLRAFIRKAINNTFYTFIYDTQRHNGVAELLEILGSIINGFALPLKQEHKTFLKKVLIPMHKVRALGLFHQQLAYCVTQFVNKDSTLAVPVIRGFVKYWPVTNSAKEVLFLNELEEVLELTQPAEFKIVMSELFTQIGRSIGSPHFQVAERALFMWHNEYVSGLIADHRDVILPVIYPVLVRNSKHWNVTVANLTESVLKIYSDMDAELVQMCHQRHTEAEQRTAENRKRFDESWREYQEVYEKVQQQANDSAV